MGNNAARHNHGSQLGELGWLDATEVVTGAPGNTYTVTPYFATGGTKLVRVPRGDGTFFDLDVRMTHGSFDNFTAGSPAVSGATIRIGKGTATPTRTPQATELLDTTPGTTDLKDAPLLVGRTITDPVSTISFTTMSASSSGVTVRVREGIAPSAPGSATATGTSAPAVDVTWGAASDNVAVTGYRVSRDGAAVATTDGAARAWTDSAVTPGATHTYAVAAIDGSGNVGPAATSVTTVPGTPPEPTPTPEPTPEPTPTPDPSASPDPTPTPDPSADPGSDVQAPTEPAPLTGEPAITTVTLSWGPATDDTGVAGYRISRNGTAIATATDTTWRDTGRKPLTTYTYTVVALDVAGNASPASQLSVRTRADTVRPTTPTNFRKVKRSGGYVTFAWNAASDNVKVVKYRIYRVGRSMPIATTTNTRIRIWTRHGAWYYVRAFDAAGNRSPSSRAVRGRL
jgi:chitodextrinase